MVAVLVVALMQLMMSGNNNVPAPVTEEPRVELLVASKDLKTGGEIKSGDVRWQKWPKSSVFPGAIIRKDDAKAIDSIAKESRLARDVADGEPLLLSALIGEAKGNFIAATLTAGNRAVSIGVSATSMVGGFVAAGDYVDILMTYKDSIKTDDDDPRVETMVDRNLKKYATETILQNIRVLAVDQKSSRPEDGKVKVGKTITLDVSLEDSEKLALAEKLGDLTLVLRGIGDDTVVEKNWPTITDSRLITIDDEISTEYKKLKGDTGINPRNVRIYNGGSVQSVPAQ